MRKVKAIRSLRVVKNLLANDQQLLRVEPSVQSPGYSVFIFKDTPELQQILTESNRKYSAN